MDWVSSVIWWHCYPLRFVGAETWADELSPTATSSIASAGSRAVDYPLDLGVKASCSPRSSPRRPRVRTLDYFRVDPRLGDLDNVNELVGHCQERGIRVCRTAR